MERLLVLHLESAGWAAEAVLNGVPLARVGGGRRVAVLPVHEYTLAGANELQLVLRPGALGAEDAEPEPLLADGVSWASVRLLLPRMGSVADPSSVRTLAQIDISPAADTLLMTPHAQTARVELPVAFPRWSWLDAPVIAESNALKAELAAWLLEIAVGLSRGHIEPLLQALRLRLGDLAVAYQRNPAEDLGRLRAQFQALWAQGALKLWLPVPSQLRLRSVAGGRLLECLRADGSPALQAVGPDGSQLSWPLRVARVEGRFYGLR